MNGAGVAPERSVWPERSVAAEGSVGTERSVGAEGSVGAERVLPARPAGGPALWGIHGAGRRALWALRRASRAGSGGRPRRLALAGLRRLGRGGLVQPVGGCDAQEHSGGRSAHDGGRACGKAMSSLHDNSQVDAHGGPGELFVRTARAGPTSHGACRRHAEPQWVSNAKGPHTRAFRSAPASNRSLEPRYAAHGRIHTGGALATNWSPTGRQRAIPPAV
jgi:hypothetical protein